MAGSDAFLRFISLADLLLHPFPFGGSKTALDSLVMSKSLVALRGDSLRSRMASSLLMSLGNDTFVKECCVADTVSEYVEKALHLGRNETYRDVVSKFFARNVHRVFSDSTYVSEWSKFIERAVSSSRLETLSSAMRYYREGYLEESEQILRVLTKYGSSSANILSDIGAVLADQWKLLDAEKILTKAIEINPSHAGATMNLAVLKHRLGSFNDAEKFHRKALELHNYTDTALSNFAGFLRDRGRDQDAVNLLTQRLFNNEVSDDMDTLATLTQWSSNKNIESVLLNNISRSYVLHAREQYPLSCVSLVTALSRLGQIVDSSKILEKISQSMNDHNQVQFGSKQQIHLIVQYYKPNLKTRREEIENVLRRNIENKYVNMIHLFVSSADLPVQKNEKIRIVPYEESRLTFRDALRYAQSLQNQIVILANADIMFDESLRNLLNLSEAYRSQHAMALLRWEERNRLIPRSDQQDSWIFFPPLSNFTYIESETNFHLGALRCDNRFAEILSCAGYSVVNPCLAIRTHHVHSDNKTRTYRTRDQVRGKGRYVLLSDL